VFVCLLSSLTVNHQYAFVRRGSMVSIVAYLNLRTHSVTSVHAVHSVQQALMHE